MKYNKNKVFKSKPLIGLKKLKTVVKPSFWRLFNKLHDNNSFKLIKNNDLNDVLYKLKNNIYDNKLDIISGDKLKSCWIQLMRTSFRGQRVGGVLKAGIIKKRKKLRLSLKVNKNSIKWIKDISLKFLPFSFKKFHSKSFFTYKNNNYWRIVSFGRRNVRKFNYFAQVNGILYQWPIFDNRRRKQRLMALTGYKVCRLKSFSNFKLYKVKFGSVASKFLKINNKAKFHKIDLINLSCKFSSLIFKELIMLFFFWVIYYLSSFYYLYFKVLKKFDLFIF